MIDQNALFAAHFKAINDSMLATQKSLLQTFEQNQALIRKAAEDYASVISSNSTDILSAAKQLQDEIKKQQSDILASMASAAKAT